MHQRLPTYSSLVVVVSLVAIGCDRGTNLPASGDSKSAVTESRVEATTSPKEIATQPKPDWNDKSREELYTTLRKHILGELRLAKNSRELILELCRQVYIDDPCPESERGTFIQFATDELKRVAAQLKSEKAKWPAVTDCDRLDRVEGALRQTGILFWQASPCCDSCTLSDLPDRINVIEGRDPGFRKRLRGYAFFIDQNMPDTLAERSRISVYLGYGWLSPDNSEVDPEVYEKNALGIAREVRDCLAKEGLNVNWDGSFSTKIGVSLNWQRRTMLK